MRKEELNKENLQKISDYAEQITGGKARYTRFTTKEVQGFARGGKLHVEASLIAGREVGAGETQDERKERQENDVENYAKAKDIWLENAPQQLAEKYGEPINAGSEAIVYDNGAIVVKTKNLFHYANLQEALDGITLHNTYFPETAQKVIGFGNDKNGDFQIIIEQPYIKEGDRKATPEEIRQFAAEKGYEPVKHSRTGYDYKNSQTILEDLHDENVIRTPDGRIVPIDTTMFLNTPDRKKYEGTRKVGNDIVLC